MLKIKDDVNLQELKRFGFVYCGNPEYMIFNSIYDLSDISFNVKDKVICINLSNSSIYCHDEETLDEDYEKVKETYLLFKNKIKELKECGIIEEE